jgi:hypothetical protein
MLTRPRRDAERGQVLLLALAFIAFFGLVATAVLQFGSSVAIQLQRTKAAAQANSLFDGGAILGAVNALYSGGPCAVGANGTMVMQGGDSASFTIHQCDPGSPAPYGSALPTLATQCSLCLLSPGPGSLTLHNGANLTVTGPMSINGQLDLTGGGSVTSQGSVAMVGCADLNGNQGCQSFASQISPSPVRISMAQDPFSLGSAAQVGVPLVAGPCLSISYSASATIPADTCYSSLSLQGPGTGAATYTLSPGWYVFTGPLSLSGQANLTGSGVTLYFTCPARSSYFSAPCSQGNDDGGSLDDEGGSTDLTAIAGTKDDVLIYFDPNETGPSGTPAGESGDCRNNSPLICLGGTSQTLEGTLYAPSAAVGGFGTGSLTIGGANGQGDLVAAELIAAEGAGAVSLPDPVIPKGGYCWVYDETPVSGTSGTITGVGHAVVASGSCKGGTGLINVNDAP